MIEFGDAFLALNVIPQAATTGARGRRHAADRQPWDVRKEFIVSARRAPRRHRRHPVCTTLLRSEAQAGPQAINPDIAWPQGSEAERNWRQSG